MNWARKFSAVALASVLCGAGAHAGPSARPREYWPSWVGGGPPGGLPRPKMEKVATMVNLGDVGAPLGVQVRFWADVPDQALKPGNEFKLVYQIRLHTKKGEPGPILGTAATPEGVTFPVAALTDDGHWNGIEGVVDVTRKDVSGMTNLAAAGRTGPAVLRVEPHVFDEAAKKFLTPGRTPAIILIAGVGQDGAVQSLTPLSEWVATDGVHDTDKVLGVLNDLDEYDANGNNLGDAFLRLLSNPKTEAKAKARIIAAIPSDVLGTKSNFYLSATLDELAKGDNAEIRAAVTAKRAERR